MVHRPQNKFKQSTCTCTCRCRATCKLTFDNIIIHETTCM